MQSIVQIIHLLLDVLTYIIVAHIIMSWLVGFGVLNTRQPIVAAVWDGLNRLLDPFYSRIRRYLPDTGALDLAPLALFFGIVILRILISNNF